MKHSLTVDPVPNDASDILIIAEKDTSTIELLFYVLRKVVELPTVSLFSLL